MIGSVKSLGDQYYPTAVATSKRTTRNNYGGVEKAWMTEKSTSYSYIENMEEEQGLDIGEMAEGIYDEIRNNLVKNTINGKSTNYIYTTNKKWLIDENDKTFLTSLVMKTFKDKYAEDYPEVYKELRCCHREISNLVKLVSHQIATHYTKNVDFDNMDNLFHFENITLDLITMTFRERRHDDYASMFACHLDNLQLDKEGHLVFTKEIEESIQVWTTIFEDIFTNPEVRKTYTEILCNSFSGNVLDKFIVANGCGSNGKSFLHSVMTLIHKDYAYKGSTSTLTNKIKDVSPAIANHNRKRFSLFSEPEENEKLMFSVVKDMTGGDNINARGLFTNDTKTIMAGVKICECNARLAIQGKTDYSMTRRIVDVLFKSCFKPKEELKNCVETEYVSYKTANLEYMTTEWKNKHTSGLFYYLFDYMIKNGKNFNNLGKLYIAEQITERSNSYITEQNELLAMVNEFCKPEAGKGISMFKLSQKIREDHTYTANMTKKELKLLGNKALQKRMKEDPQLQNQYVDGRKSINGVDYNNVLVGWSFKTDKERGIEEPDNDDDDDDEKPRCVLD
jgi:phage/plasmid-associated DNA primase